MLENDLGNRGEILPEPHDGLPDSSKLSGFCPRCGKQSSFDIIGNFPVTVAYPYKDNVQEVFNFENIDRISVLFCRHCKQGIVVIEEKFYGDYSAREKTYGGEMSYRGINWWPLTEANLSKDIPKDISEVFNEATMTLAANCPRASVAMARRTLEAITVDKGELKGSLYNRLESLSNKGILHPSLAEWVTEVRLIGNKGAHFDPMNEVSLEDANDLLSFVRELLRFLYELPADLDRRRTR